jgi:hypothetical protein
MILASDLEWKGIGGVMDVSDGCVASVAQSGI